MIPVKVNHNYFTLYKASSLNLKTIWWKRVTFFVFLRCRIFKPRSHGSRFPFAFIEMNVWKLMGSFWYTYHVQWRTNYVTENVKSTITADFRGTSRLIKWIYKERYELLILKRNQLLNNSLKATKLKLMSC